MLILFKNPCFKCETDLNNPKFRSKSFVHWMLTGSGILCKCAYINTFDFTYYFVIQRKIFGEFKENSF